MAACIGFVSKQTSFVAGPKRTFEVSLKTARFGRVTRDGSMISSQSAGAPDARAGDARKIPGRDREQVARFVQALIDAGVLH